MIQGWSSKDVFLAHENCRFFLLQGAEILYSQLRGQNLAQVDFAGLYIYILRICIYAYVNVLCIYLYSNIFLRSVINKHGDRKIGECHVKTPLLVIAIPMGDLHGHMARAACGWFMAPWRHGTGESRFVAENRDVLNGFPGFPGFPMTFRMEFVEQNFCSIHILYP